jgi:hypothetical protein
VSHVSWIFTSAQSLADLEPYRFSFHGRSSSISRSFNVRLRPSRQKWIETSNEKL